MNSKSIKLAKAKADKYFSLYIRERDKGKPCITCGRRDIEADCGHFISRRYEATRYNEKNAHGQCIKCNRFEYGNQFKHGQMIDKMYGAGTAEDLELKSHWATKRTKFDFEMIAKEYKEKYNKLKNT